MLLSVFCALTWSLKGAYAFRDTSPFFYFSTAEYCLLMESESGWLTPCSTDGSPQDFPQIITSPSLLQAIKEPLSRCASDAYILVSQPGVNAVDFAVADAVPRLRQSMLKGGGERKIKASFSASDVLGELEADEVEAFLHEICKAEVMNVDASSISTLPARLAACCRKSQWLRCNTELC